MTDRHSLKRRLAELEQGQGARGFFILQVRTPEDLANVEAFKRRREETGHHDCILTIIRRGALLGEAK